MGARRKREGKLTTKKHASSLEKLPIRGPRNRSLGVQKNKELKRTEGG